MHNNSSKLVGILLCIIGGIGLIANFFIIYSGEKYNKDTINEFRNQTRTSSYEENTKSINQSFSQSDIVAILKIPSIDVEYPVVKGVDSETLKKSLGYFENTSMPGEKGNFAVAGHRNSNYAKYFKRLDEVSKGDKIIVETRTSIYTYTVTETFKIHQNETDILNSTNEREITLLTCTNGFKPQYRLGVKGVLSEQE